MAFLYTGRAYCSTQDEYDDLFNVLACLLLPSEETTSSSHHSPYAPYTNFHSTHLDSPRPSVLSPFNSASKLHFTHPRAGCFKTPVRVVRGEGGTEGESGGGGVRVGEGGGEERRGEATSQPPPKAARH